MSDNTYKCKISKVPLLISLVSVLLAAIIPLVILYFVFIHLGQIPAEEFFPT